MQNKLTPTKIQPVLLYVLEEEKKKVRWALIYNIYLKPVIQKKKKISHPYKDILKPYP